MQNPDSGPISREGWSTRAGAVPEEEESDEELEGRGAFGFEYPGWPGGG